MSEVKSNAKDGAAGNTRQEEYFQITFATLDDVDSLVTLHYKCFTKRDHIAMRFGKPFIWASYKWFVTSPETFIVIAKHGDKLVGFQSVSERPYDAPMLRAGWREALLGLVLHPWLAFHPELLGRLWRLLFRRHKEITDNIQEAQLAFIGVDPQSQGKGIGKALVIAAVNSCQERGLKLVTTGVLKQNTRSLAMLKGAGFVETPERGTKSFVYLQMDLDQPGR